MHTVLWCCEGCLYYHSDISTNCRHSVVVHSWRVQLLHQYHNENISCCTNLSWLSRVWQVHVGWVSPILDCTVSRSSEPRKKDAVNCCIVLCVYLLLLQLGGCWLCLYTGKKEKITIHQWTCGRFHAPHVCLPVPSLHQQNFDLAVYWKWSIQLGHNLPVYIHVKILCDPNSSRLVRCRTYINVEESCITIKKIGCFNHIVVTLLA